MPVGSCIENCEDGTEFLSVARVLLQQAWEVALKLLGGQDLRGSGFENEETDPDYSEEV